MKGKLNAKKMSILLLVLVVAVLAFFSKSILNWTKLKWFYHKGDITTSVVNDFSSYVKQGNDDYLIYLYDSKNCKECATYGRQLLDYSNQSTALPLYKVDLQKAGTEITEDKFFVDSRFPVLIEVKKGKEFYRYVGLFDTKLLPKKQ
jgi:hypothetical protein